MFLTLQLRRCFSYHANYELISTKVGKVTIPEKTLISVYVLIQEKAINHILSMDLNTITQSANNTSTALYS